MMQISPEMDTALEDILDVQRFPRRANRPGRPRAPALLNEQKKAHIQALIAMHQSTLSTLRVGEDDDKIKQLNGQIAFCKEFITALR